MNIANDLRKYTPREEQQRVHDFIFKVKSEKEHNKFFLLNLPTGVGKSHLALMIANEYIAKVDPSAKVDIITATKILQSQYSDEYESISDLKGKENYSCHQYSCSCAQGMEFARLNKSKCDFCPYDSARLDYINGHVSLTNFYLYLIYAIYNQKVQKSRNARVLIVDESHEFDSVMSNFISVKITDFMIKKFKFNNENELIDKLRKVKSVEDYIEFLKMFLNEANDTIGQIDTGMVNDETRTNKADKRDLKISKLFDLKNNDVKLMQLISDLRSLQTKIEVFLEDYKDDTDNWVLEKSYNEKTSQYEMSLEPLWAHKYLEKYVWCNYDMVILMSGTILNKQIFTELNGLDADKSVYYSMPSPFEVKNIPIYYMPVGKMSFLKKEETFKKYVPFIEKILKKYSDKKGIIHTNSFELSQWISRDIKDKRLIFHDSGNKDEMLKKHLEGDKPTVIVSPSMSMGVSFDHDKARFQIVAKIPYPSLNSQKNKLRQKSHPDWYRYMTTAALVQTFGRVIRSKTDYGDTIIIDESFGDILRYNSDFLPDWILSAIKTVKVK